MGEQSPHEEKPWKVRNVAERDAEHQKTLDQLDDVLEFLTVDFRRLAEHLMEYDENIKRIGLTRETKRLMGRLAQETGNTPSDILVKALTLYDVANKARSEGNRIAVLSPDDEIIREIIGFEPLAPQSSSK